MLYSRNCSCNILGVEERGAADREPRAEGRRTQRPGFSSYLPVKFAFS